jgi:uncharacterized membrane protein
VRSKAAEEGPKESEGVSLGFLDWNVSDVRSGEARQKAGKGEAPARVKVVVASVMQPTVEYSRQANASL